MIPTLVWMVGLVGSASGGVRNFASSPVVENPEPRTETSSSAAAEVGFTDSERIAGLIRGHEFAGSSALSIGVGAARSISLSGAAMTGPGVDDPTFGNRVSGFGLTAPRTPAHTDRPFPLDPGGGQVPSASTLAVLAIAGCAAARRRRHG